VGVLGFGILIFGILSKHKIQMNTKIIHWGIIGCGNVTEKKSGPAFNKVPNSSLVAVMRRDATKAEDYALRHGVPRWYSDAAKLVNDAEVNAIYIATPPDSHEYYVQMALEAGKPVYVEKPMTLDYAAALRLQKLALKYKDRVVVAHYRRKWPQFEKVQQLLADGIIGKPLMAKLRLFKKSLTPEELQKPGVAWRINPAVSGGGLFHDLAPHQLDLLLHWLGPAGEASGFSSNLGGLYAAPDMVNGSFMFNSGVQFTGQWCFCAPEFLQEDLCEIVGSKGRIRCSVFGSNEVHCETSKGKMEFSFEPPEHNQIYLIDAVVKFFRGEAPNPCPAAEGAEVMRIMDAFSRQ
jgi:predicted dehydrogenase